MDLYRNYNYLVHTENKISANLLHIIMADLRPKAGSKITKCDKNFSQIQEVS